MGGRVVLISTYELGRQPFGLASPAAWLRGAGATVSVQDLAVSAFDPGPVCAADLVAVFVPMHTATKLAGPVLAKVKELNPRAHVCVFGLYAALNAEHLRRLGADTVLGGEFETGLLGLYRQVVERGERPAHQTQPLVSTERQAFTTPDRTGLPPLEKYARLVLPSGETRVVGHTETSRGCRHLCRHCPVVPVYNGRFRVVPEDVVLADVRQQVNAGAQHITFGDPDFFNGPAHATRIVRRVHEEFPALSYDVTIKIEHLRRRGDLLPVLRRTGCVLVTSAVEAFDDAVLARLDKGHTRLDVENVARALDAEGLPFNPTFVPFTPWTTLDGYLGFLSELARLNLVDGVSPVQYTIRLLLPAGSRLLELPDVAEPAGAFDATALYHPWRHPDPRLDRLHGDLVALVTEAQRVGRTRREIFADVWRAACPAGGDPPPLPPRRSPPPHLTEPWYCCAEPTEEQFFRL
ncbi:CUAEP/CCAEP-tail radical SAM (seleno)protein [Rhizohabitans arisaemae]|uniref:CUAEP/CCAEP-tail radical SAM (seleno)protein n=1 Tax=Rhizohabitans arisaemae TaxID=2720610 RepID=UPI0024B0495B|nr:CUAEP/CCAEP-tail radical SAM protein [Rhizohabitans arisaemae]